MSVFECLVPVAWQQIYRSYSHPKQILRFMVFLSLMPHIISIAGQLDNIFHGSFDSCLVIFSAEIAEVIHLTITEPPNSQSCPQIQVWALTGCINYYMQDALWCLVSIWIYGQIWDIEKQDSLSEGICFVLCIDVFATQFHSTLEWQKKLQLQIQKKTKYPSFKTRNRLFITILESENPRFCTDQYCWYFNKLNKKKLCECVSIFFFEIVTDVIGKLSWKWEWGKGVFTLIWYGRGWVTSWRAKNLTV